MKNWYLAALLFVSGCNCAACGNTASADPTERGLSYVAAAIVLSAVIRALANH